MLKPALFSERRGICGAITARHIARFFGAYFLLCATGFGLAQYSTVAPLQIFGMGLMLPGGGFFAHVDFISQAGLAHILSATGALALFILSLGIWFATGNALLPPLLWATLAVTTAMMGHGAPRANAPILLLLGICGGIITAIIATACWQMWAYGKRRKSNQILATAAVSSTHTPAIKTQAENETDAQRMKFILDRALQPVENFDGFEWLDQFQTAAVRYQINFLGYALSMAQASHLSALHGYLDDAQGRLVKKLTDHRVWKYWRLENAWGNLRTDADPVLRENIMYTGFALLQMTLHEKSGGNDRYNKENAFTLRQPSGNIFPHNMQSLADSLQRESRRRDFHLTACEPNWIYPLCNTIGAAALKSYAPQAWAQQEEIFRERLEQEFIDTAGHFVPCRSVYTGLAIPNIGGIMPQAMPCFFLNALYPDIALRHWTLLRERMLKNGNLQRRAFWPIDTGNYRFSRAAAYAATALAAAEMGDAEIKKLCLEALDDECPANAQNDNFYRPRASVWAHGVEMMARATSKDAFKNLINEKTTPAAPFIDFADYSQILFSYAKSTDGTLTAAAELRFGQSSARLKFGGLIPKACYKFEGLEIPTLVADDTGRAAAEIQARGKIQFKLARMS